MCPADAARGSATASGPRSHVGQVIDAYTRAREVHHNKLAAARKLHNDARALNDALLRGREHEAAFLATEAAALALVILGLVEPAARVLPFGVTAPE
jgi:hypothetical protein